MAAFVSAACFRFDQDCTLSIDTPPFQRCSDDSSEVRWRGAIELCPVFVTTPNFRLQSPRPRYKHDVMRGREKQGERGDGAATSAIFFSMDR